MKTWNEYKRNLNEATVEDKLLGFVTKIFSSLEKDFPKYDGNKIADFNKVLKVLNSDPKLAKFKKLNSQIVTSFADFKKGQVTKDVAIKNAVKYSKDSLKLK